MQQSSNLLEDRKNEKKGKDLNAPISFEQKKVGVEKSCEYLCNLAILSKIK